MIANLPHEVYLAFQETFGPVAGDNPRAQLDQEEKEQINTQREKELDDEEPQGTRRAARRLG
jgi:hypothetical protein